MASLKRSDGMSCIRPKCHEKFQMVQAPGKSSHLLIPLDAWAKSFFFFMLRVLENCILQKKHKHIFQCFIMFHEVCLMFCLSFQKQNNRSGPGDVKILRRFTPFRLEEFLDEDWGLGVTGGLPLHEGGGGGCVKFFF